MPVVSPVSLGPLGPREKPLREVLPIADDGRFCTEDAQCMVWPHRLIVLASFALLAALPSAAGALPMNPAYPRTRAVIGTGGGVRLAQMQAKVQPAGKRVRVTVRLAGVSTGGPHRMMLSVAACAVRPPSYTPNRPLCRPAATAVHPFAITEAPFSLTKALTIPRPATAPGALDVRVTPTTSTEPPPKCKGSFSLRDVCRTFPQTGELLLNGNAWKHQPGTWWGITATAPAGIVLDRIAYNSQVAGWVAASTTAVDVVTTQGFAAEPAAKTWHTPLAVGIQTVWRTPEAFGGAKRPRTGIRVLDYAAAIGGRRLFTVTLPLPHWQPTSP